jgi:serine/threonine-protein phosphatase PGAM5
MSKKDKASPQIPSPPAEGKDLSLEDTQPSGQTLARFFQRADPPAKAKRPAVDRTEKVEVAPAKETPTPPAADKAAIDKKLKGPYYYLHLVRHGQYVIDKTKDDFGFLSELGQRQSEFLADKLLELPVRFIFSSDHARALETAKIIRSRFPEHEVKETHMLSEGIPWYPNRVRRERGLSWWTLRAHRQRMDVAFAQFFRADADMENDAHDLLISHGNVIRYFVCKALDIDYRRWTRFEIPNCSICTIRVDTAGVMKLVRFGEIGHIPNDLRTVT